MLVSFIYLSTLPKKVGGGGGGRANAPFVHHWLRHCLIIFLVGHFYVVESKDNQHEPRG